MYFKSENERNNVFLKRDKQTDRKEVLMRERKRDRENIFFKIDRNMLLRKRKGLRNGERKTFF